MPSRMLKMRHDFPAYMENRLVQKWNYAVDKRVWKDCIIFKKSYISDKESKDPLAGVRSTIRASANDTVGPVNLNSHRDELSAYQKRTLERRCDNIVNHFPDPYSAVIPIRIRLHNVAQALMPLERAFIEEFMEENFPLTLVEAK